MCYSAAYNVNYAEYIECLLANNAANIDCRQVYACLSMTSKVLILMGVQYPI